MGLATELPPCVHDRQLLAVHVRGTLHGQEEGRVLRGVTSKEVSPAVIWNMLTKAWSKRPNSVGASSLKMDTPRIESGRGGEVRGVRAGGGRSGGVNLHGAKSARRVLMPGRS